MKKDFILFSEPSGRVFNKNEWTEYEIRKFIDEDGQVTYSLYIDNLMHTSVILPTEQAPADWVFEVFYRELTKLEMDSISEMNESEKIFIETPDLMLYHLFIQLLRFGKYYDRFGNAIEFKDIKIDYFYRGATNIVAIVYFSGGCLKIDTKNKRINDMNISESDLDLIMGVLRY